MRPVRSASRSGRPWPFRNRQPTNDPRTSFQAHVLGTRSQRAFFIDGLFASASDVVVVSFLTVYAIALGASNTEIGWLAIANGLAGVAALSPGAWIAERTRSRKLVVLLSSGGIGRLTILLMAAAPLAMRHHEAVIAVIVVTGVRWFVGSLGHPSWVSLLSDIVPLDLRQLYVSRRMLGIAAVAAIGAPLTGFFIRFTGGVDHVPSFQWALLIAFGLGMVSTYFYSRIEEAPRLPHEARRGGSTRALLGDRGFMQYLGGTLLLHTTTMIAGPFFVAYLVRDLGANAAQVGILATVDAVSAVIGQYFAGGLAVRFGSPRLLHGSMLLLPLLPLLWFFSTDPWHTTVPHLIGGAAWAMFNLAAFNLVLEFAPEENLPRYAATHQAMVLAATLIGPVIGTLIVAAYGIKAAMLISAAGRVVALGVTAWPRRGGGPARPTLAAPTPARRRRPGGPPL